MPQLLSSASSAAKEADTAPVTAQRPFWHSVWPHLLGWGAAAALLVGVLALYQQPEFLVMLSEMIWACFG